jgi:tRNA(Ile)-lysidine synthase
MLKKVLRYIKENNLFVPGDTIVVAVSGGADSVALLDILASLRDYRLNLVATHLNHLLRGAESDADEEFVRKLARSYGLSIEVRRVNVREIAWREKRSLEDAGRSARYAFFDEVASSHNARAVALAHHADDQAETVLLRLLRGAGGTGLCAMAPKSVDRYVRPLLSVTRVEIVEYLQKRGVPWRTDSSNDDTDFLRNRIRHELIPFLSTYNPAISERLAATAHALAADEELLDAATASMFTHHRVRNVDRVTLSVPGVLTELRGIRLRLYRLAILQARGDLARISFRHLQEIDRLFFSPKPHLTLTLPDSLRVAKSYGVISFFTVEEDKSSVLEELLVKGPGIYPLSCGGMLTVDFAQPTGDLRSAPATIAYFDLDQTPFPWRIRRFRPGDRFSPFGMTGHKKVKELFIDGKIPLVSRRRIPLLFRGETLIWVGGMRRSSAALLSEQTKTVIRAELIDFTP